jgi:hypothetical protein
VRAEHRLAVTGVCNHFLRRIYTQCMPTLGAFDPFLEPEDLNQALRYATATVDDESLGIDRVA